MERTGSKAGECLPQIVGGTLNPRWVELLMGWPLNWTDLKPMSIDAFNEWLNGFTGKATQNTRYSQEAWLDGSWELGIPRVERKIKDRVSRLKAIGNGQVPQAMVLARKILTEGINDE